MAERPVDINLVPTASAADKITDEDKKKVEERAEKRARLREVYERGVVGDRLNVPLPPDMYGQWVSTTQGGTEIARMESLGFRIDTEYAKKRRLHDKGDDASYVGDVVFMVCDRETREIIDEIKAERYAEMNSPGRKQREEKKFEGENRANASSGIGTLIESDVKKARKDEIAAAMNKTNN